MPPPATPGLLPISQGGAGCAGPPFAAAAAALRRWRRSGGCRPQPPAPPVRAGPALAACVASFLRYARPFCARRAAPGPPGPGPGAKPLQGLPGSPGRTGRPGGRLCRPAYRLARRAAVASPRHKSKGRGSICFANLHPFTLAFWLGANPASRLPRLAGRSAGRHLGCLGKPAPVWWWAGLPRPFTNRARLTRPPLAGAFLAPCARGWGGADRRRQRRQGCQSGGPGPQPPGRQAAPQGRQAEPPKGAQPSYLDTSVITLIQFHATFTAKYNKKALLFVKAALPKKYTRHRARFGVK